LPVPSLKLHIDDKCERCARSNLMCLDWPEC
jgi:hypothetical protein